MLKFDIITLFPSMFEGPLTESIIKRAQKNGLIEINLYQLRDWAQDKHKTVDDTPYGGGAGMVLRVDVIDKAIRDVILTPTLQLGEESDVCVIPQDDNKRRIILLTPTGKKLDQQKAIELAKYDNIILVCGHYEGFDQRVHDHLVDEEISIGDYVLTGGELPAMVLIDAISRMIPGVIKKESALNESFMTGSSNVIARSEGTKQSDVCVIPSPFDKLRAGSVEGSDKLQPNSYSLDYPVYTRPIEYKGWRVPEVLLSGDHKKIMGWRDRQKKRK